jgi:cell division protein ZapA (FtsZ GTPase activity inhibitor)
MFSDVTVINLSEELKHLQSTNDEQKEKISEYERQIENKGRNFFSKLKQELQNTCVNTTHIAIRT